jgi:hypothetical protein
MPVDPLLPPLPPLPVVPLCPPLPLPGPLDPPLPPPVPAVALLLVLEVVPDPVAPPPLVVLVVPDPVPLLVDPLPVADVPPSGGLLELNASPPHPSKRVRASTSSEVLEVMSSFLRQGRRKSKTKAPDASPVQVA